MTNIDIIPAIMPDSWEDLQNKVTRVLGIVPWVQVDVMDGVFVNSRSWPHSASGTAEARRMKSNNEKLPFIDKISYEVDLMVGAPEALYQDWIEFGAKRVIAHVESIRHFNTFLQTAAVKFPNIEFGLAINVDTSNTALERSIDKIGVVQFMGIAQIGYQGQPFDGRVIPKIKELRHRYPEVIISVDGGVNFDSAPRLIEAGVNRLVSGSAIFNSVHVGEAVERLRKS